MIKTTIRDRNDSNSLIEETSPKELKKNMPMGVVKLSASENNAADFSNVDIGVSCFLNKKRLHILNPYEFDLSNPFDFSVVHITDEDVVPDFNKLSHEEKRVLIGKMEREIPDFIACSSYFGKHMYFECSESAEIKKKLFENKFTNPHPDDLTALCSSLFSLYEKLFDEDRFFFAKDPLNLIKIIAYGIIGVRFVESCDFLKKFVFSESFKSGEVDVEDWERYCLSSFVLDGGIFLCESMMKKGESGEKLLKTLKKHMETFFGMKDDMESLWLSEISNDMERIYSAVRLAGLHFLMKFIRDNMNYVFGEPDVKNSSELKMESVLNASAILGARMDNEKNRNLFLTSEIFRIASMKMDSFSKTIL